MQSIARSGHISVYKLPTAPDTPVTAGAAGAAGAAMPTTMYSADIWEHQRVASYLQLHNFNRVTLQFPDDLLQFATSVAQELQLLLQQRGSAAKVYVLADTSYNPLSIDEVAAAHVKADCVVHYGYASLHPVSRTPALCVLPKQQLDIQETSTWLVQQLASLHEQALAANNAEQQQQQQQQQEQLQAQESRACVICCDQAYLHHLPELQQAVEQQYQGPLQLTFAQSASTELWPQRSTAAAVAAAAGGSTSTTGSHTQPTASSTHDVTAGNGDSSIHKEHAGDQPAAVQSSEAAMTVPVGGLVWQHPGGGGGGDSSSSSSRLNCPHMVWLGPSASPALTHLQLSFASCPWLMLDPAGQHVAQGLSPGLDRLLKRRYYLVERARGAAMVGLLVGTLGAAGYKTALEQLRRLATEAGKKTYTLLMGKPNPAKLANFPEIEVFVMLADPQGLILDSKEYLHPIITPHEAYLAFTGQDFDAPRYRLDFGDLLALDKQGSMKQQVLTAPVRDAGVGGNITEIGNSSEAVVDDGSVHALSASAGALMIAGSSSSSQALTGNKAGRQVQAQSAAQYLTQHRTYQGLETPATGAAILPAAIAVQGRSGRAAVYTDEPY